MKLFDKFKKKGKSTEVNTADNIKLDIRVSFENNLKYISDTIILYLVERLIKLNKIIITEKDEKLWNCTIKIGNY